MIMIYHLTLKILDHKGYFHKKDSKDITLKILMLEQRLTF